MLHSSFFYYFFDSGVKSRIWNGAMCPKGELQVLKEIVKVISLFVQC